MTKIEKGVGHLRQVEPNHHNSNLVWGEGTSMFEWIFSTLYIYIMSNTGSIPIFPEFSKICNRYVLEVDLTGERSFGRELPIGTNITTALQLLGVITPLKPDHVYFDVIISGDDYHDVTSASRVNAPIRSRLV